MNNNYTKTDINGFPARFVLTKDPRDPTGTASIVVKVIDVDATHVNPCPQFSTRFTTSTTLLFICKTRQNSSPSIA